MKQDSVIHIAYADDHVAVRKGIVSFIELLGGISVDIEANNGNDLIRQLEKSYQLPDVVILDIHMPQMDGFQVMEILKDKWPDVKTLVLTAFETEVYLIQMIRTGINGYLLKSCHPQEIKHALESICEYGYYFANTTEEHFFSQVQKGKIKLPHFSDNEMEYLKYCSTDLSYGQIAERMGTTVKAIQGYMSRLCEKLHVRGRIGLAMCAIQFGFIKTEQQKPTKFIVSSRK